MMVLPVYIMTEAGPRLTSYVVALRELVTPHLAVISDVTNQVIGVLL